MFDKIKPLLITALVAIVAYSLWTRFAPDSLQAALTGKKSA